MSSNAANCKKCAFLLAQIVAQLSGLLRHEIMDFMFANPTMLDDLDFLYKSDTARKLMFYYQVHKNLAT